MKNAPSWPPVLECFLSSSYTSYSTEQDFVLKLRCSWQKPVSRLIMDKEEAPKRPAKVSITTISR